MVVPRSRRESRPPPGGQKNSVKKRLRKKRRMGEFREWGCVMHFRLKSDSDLNEFLDIFVERVEEIGCYCGGGGSGSSLSMMVELGRKEGDPEARLAGLIQWALSCPMVKSVRSSEIVDLCSPPSRKLDADLSYLT